MASFKFPLSVAEKQHILFMKPLPPAELTAWGNRYLEAGQPFDALDFFSVAGDRPAMESLAQKAVEGSDLVLFLNSCRALGVDPEPRRLEKIRDQATAANMESVARRVATLLAPQG